LAPAETAASLAMAFEQITEKAVGGPAEIFLFADDQATTWEGMESIRAPHDLDADVYWVCPPLADRTNVAVTSIRPSTDRLLLRHAQRVFVSLRSYANEPIDELPVELLVDGVFRARKSVALLPGQQATVDFDVRFAQPGSHYLTARVTDDALQLDNSMSAGVEVVDSLRVVVLRDRDKQDKFDSAWGFFEVARRAVRLTGEGSGGESAGAQLPAVDFVLHEFPSDEPALPDADAIYLDGGCTVSVELAKDLAEFVDRGGGLVLAADSSVDADAWNRVLGDAGLLPARLGALRVEQIGGDRYRSLSRTDFDALPLKAFQTDERGDLTQAKFYSWFPLEASRRTGLQARPENLESHYRGRTGLETHPTSFLGDNPGRADVLVRFDDHSPWLLRQQRDAGRVLLSATGLAGRGHNLFVREFALPLLIGVFQEGAAGRIYPRTVVPGQRVRLRLSAPETLDGVSFGRPDREPIAVQTKRLGDRVVATVDRTDLDSDLYRFLAIRDGGSQRIWFGVQGPRVDSDLSPLSDRTRSAVREQLAVVEASDWQQLDQLLAAARTGHEWHPWVIVLLLGALVGEMLLQRRFAPQRNRSYDCWKRIEN
jgi:hypothetical protein